MVCLLLSTQTRNQNDSQSACQGFTRQPESPNAHISGSRPSKTPPKFNERTPKREKNVKTVAGEGKQERNFGWSSEGAVRPNLGRTHENLEHPTDTPHTFTQHTSHNTRQDKLWCGFERSSRTTLDLARTVPWNELSNRVGHGIPGQGRAPRGVCQCLQSPLVTCRQTFSLQSLSPVETSPNWTM